MDTRYSTVLRTELLDLKNRIAENHIRAGQKASGRTVASLEVLVNGYEGLLLGRSFFGVLETGRKPGKVPKGFYRIILQWVKDKGLQVDKPETFAYFVSRKIAAEGSRLYRQGGRSDIYSNEIERTLESIRKRFGDEMISEFETIVLNTKEYVY